MAIHGARSFELDSEARKVFPSPHQKVVVAAGGEPLQLDKDTKSIPINKLGEFLAG